MLEYRLLEAFATVIERGGFEKAAQALAITQSAVSQRIRQLELDLGEVLVVRENPPRATALGERILRHWRQVRDLEGELRADLSPSDDGAYRQLSIGVHTDSLSAWLMAALIPFMRRHSVTVEILQDEQDRVLGFLKEGIASACVSLQADSVQGCSVERVGTLRYLLVASPDFQKRHFPAGLDAEALARAPLVHSDRKDRLQRDALERLLGAQPPSGPAHYAPSTEAYLAIVLAGLGYGLVSAIQAAPHLAAGRLLELDRRARLDLGLYWHRWRKGPAILDELSALIRESAPKA